MSVGQHQHLLISVFSILTQLAKIHTAPLMPAAQVSLGHRKLYNIHFSEIEGFPSGNTSRFTVPWTKLVIGLGIQCVTIYLPSREILLHKSENHSLAV